MSKVHFFIIAIVIAVIGSSACKIFPDPPPPQSHIEGNVELYDEGFNNLDYSDMEVSAWSSGTVLTYTTERDGSYRFYDPPAGIYSLSFTKAGYGTYLLTGVSVEAHHTVFLDFIHLGQISSTRVTLLEVDEDPNFVRINTTTEREDSVNSQRYLRYFFSTDEDVSGTNYEIYSDLIAATTGSFDYVLTLRDLRELGFRSGMKVYVRVYGESLHSNNYLGGASGKMMFPNLNSTTQPAVSFIVP